MSEEHLLVDLTALVGLGIAAQWVAWRLKMPSIVLLLVSGFLVGNFTDFVHPDEMLGDLLFPAVSLSVAVILFEGGMNLRRSEFRQWGKIVLSLVTVGVFVTWIVVSVAAWAILGFNAGAAVLMGAVLIVTGPTVIIPLMQQVRPFPPVGPILKWEGIVIDPIGAMIAVLAFQGILAETVADATSVALLGVAKTVVVGGIVGTAAALILSFVLRRRMIPDFLQNPIALMFVVVAFTVCDRIQDESGLFAAPLMGLLLSNQKRVSVRHIVEFQENVRVLLLAGLFVLLGARVRTEELLGLGWESFAFLAAVILVARPAAVALATARSQLNRRQRIYLAAIAPRGVVAAAIASVFAIRLEEIGRPVADRLVPETFFVILGTVLIYGFLAHPLARWLGVAKPSHQGVIILGAYAWAREIAKALKEEGQDVLLVDTNRANVAAARMAGVAARHTDALTEDALAAVDMRGGEFLLAMTSNDDFNSLAALHFADVFERSGIYQLPIEGAAGAQDEEDDPQHLRGRFLFDSSMTFATITARFVGGAVVMRTPITERFGFDDFMAVHGSSAVPLFLIDEAGDLVIYTTDDQPVPRAGQTLISLVEPKHSRSTSRRVTGERARGS